MTSVKCPACGLVDWNVGDCKRCGTSLVGLEADGGYDADGYFSGPFEGRGAGRSLRVARGVIAVCAVVVLGLSALGALYLAHKPAKPQWFWSFYRGEPTGAEIFAHNLEVTGGAARLKALRSFRAEGRVTFAGGETARLAQLAGGNVTLVMHAKEPNKVETEMEIGAPSESAAPYARQPTVSDYFKPAGPKIRVSFRRGFDGTRGWEYIERTILTPGSTVPIKQYNSRELEGEELEQMKRSSPMVNLGGPEGEYTGIKLAGRLPVMWSTRGEIGPHGGVVPDEDLRGHEAYVVSGINKEGKEEKFYFDTLTGLMLRANYGEMEVGDETVKMDCIFADYKEVGGILLPHRFYFKNGEEAMTLTVEKYLPNEPIPDSTFEVPE